MMLTAKKCNSNKLPVTCADILVPNENIDRGLFAVVACDQFTQDLEYWKHVYEKRENVPSAAHLMLPEVYLNDGQEVIDRRIASINDNMRAYIEGGVFYEYKNTMILTRRTFADGRTRTGLIAAIDLEQYDFTPGSGSLVRATEATVLERIPPRVRIRRNSPLEMPHIMILIDDPDNTVIEPVDMAENDPNKAIYDFDLNEGGGHLQGFVLFRESRKNVLKALKALGNRQVFRKKYGLPSKTPVLLLAVGDGNHSLASAKALYEETKLPSHRYALAEIVNIHSPGLVFEPIHRILINVDPAQVEQSAFSYFGRDIVMRDGTLSKEDTDINGRGSEVFRIRFSANNIDRVWSISASRHLLAAGAIQDFIDAYLRSHPGSAVDYIHGEEEALAFGKRQNSCAFILDAMPKSDLFKSVIKNGALPRKTFSMGNAEEKRYYFECRKL